MSTNRLGRSKDLEKYWSEHLGDQPETNVAIKSIDREHIEGFREIEGYPFSGQIKLSGTFSIEIPGREGGHFTQTGRYEYRTASELFLLETPTDLVDAEKVFSDLNTQLGSSAEIQQALSLQRESLWTFIKEADDVETLVLRGPEGTYDATKLLALLRYEDPVEALHESPEFNELRTIENIEEVITSVEGPSEIQGIQELDIDIYNTIIDKVEATYWYRGRSVDVWYHRGVLKFDAEDAVAREYVIQLFERDVLNR